jgi:outer membrane biosynthesis protein TonB
MSSALDDLLADFSKNAGTMPPVNPPESGQVLATQTAPEVAGEPEPPPADEAPPAPTEKPAEVKAAEQAKTRKPRATKAEPARSAGPEAPPALGQADPGAAPPRPAAGADQLTTEAMVAELLKRGYHVTLTA